MERLLADATKLTGVKYDISNLGDVYEAIHVIQGELGLTGVAALEAQTTLTGSANAMKASWLNVMAALTTGQGLDVAMSNLGQTVGYFLNNVIAMAGNVLAQFPALISGIAGVITANAPMLLASGSELVMQLVNGVVTNIPTAVSSFTGLVTQLVQALATNGPSFLTEGMGLISQVANGLMAAIPTLTAAIPQIITGLLTAFTTNATTLLAGGTEMVTQITSGITTAIPTIVAMAGTILADLLAAVIAAAPDLISGGVELITQIIVGLGQAIPTLLEQVPILFQQMKDAFVNVDWAGVGSDIINGIIAGVQAMASALWDAVAGIANSAVSSLKSLLGIASPSKVFRDEVGRWIPEGMAVGIEGNIKPVTSSVDHMAAAATAEMRRATAADNRVQAASGPMAGTAAGGGGQSVNVTIEFTGSLAQLGRILQPHIVQEGQRRGEAFVV